MANRESKISVGAIALLLSCAVDAQNPRPQARVDTSSPGIVNADAIVASSGDLSVVAYIEGRDVYAVTSDGQGIHWNTPVRVDGDVTRGGKVLAEGDVAVAGNNVYILWKDQRAGSRADELYFNYSNDGGATFVGEQRIDKTTPVGIGRIENWALAATRNGASDAVYIAFEVDPNGFANEQLYVVASVDGGATFGTPAHVPQGVAAGAADPDEFTIEADGANVCIAWTDNRNGSNNPFFNQSFDSGTSFGADVPLDISVTGSLRTRPEIAKHGNTVTVAWQEAAGSRGPHELHGVVSTDGGVTFSSDRLIGNYTAGVDNVDGHRVCVTTDGVVIAAWEDRRSGSDEVYAARSTDGGMSWSSDVAVSGVPAGVTRIVAGAEGSSIIVWRSETVPRRVQAAISFDNGASWQPPVALSQNNGSVDFSEVAYNDLYNNFIATWLARDPFSSDDDVYVGGFRQTSVTAVGWSDIYNPASTTLRFDCAGFGTDTLAIIGLSAGSGPVTTSDGRLFGLGPSIGPFGGPGFRATLVMGAGSSIALPNVFVGGGPAAGINVFYAAAGFSGANLGKLTDTFSFQL